MMMFNISFSGNRVDVRLHLGNLPPPIFAGPGPFFFLVVCAVGEGDFNFIIVELLVLNYHS